MHIVLNRLSLKLTGKPVQSAGTHTRILFQQLAYWQSSFQCKSVSIQWCGVLVFLRDSDSRT